MHGSCQEGNCSANGSTASVLKGGFFLKLKELQQKWKPGHLPAVTNSSEHCGWKTCCSVAKEGDFTPRSDCWDRDLNLCALGSCCTGSPGWKEWVWLWGIELYRGRSPNTLCGAGLGAALSSVSEEEGGQGCLAAAPRFRGVALARRVWRGCSQVSVSPTTTA